jgi:hypothetical protein
MGILFEVVGEPVHHMVYMRLEMHMDILLDEQIVFDVESIVGIFEFLEQHRQVTPSALAECGGKLLNL